MHTDICIDPGLPNDLVSEAGVEEAQTVRRMRMKKKRMRMRGLARQPVEEPALPPSPVPALSLLVSVGGLCSGGHGVSACIKLTFCPCSLTSATGPSWTATFDPVPMDATTGSPVSRKADMSSTQILTNPPALDAPQLRCGWAGHGRRVWLWHLTWEPLPCLLGVDVDHNYPLKLFSYLVGLRTPHPPQDLRKSQIVAK